MLIVLAYSHSIYTERYLVLGDYETLIASIVLNSPVRHNNICLSAQVSTHICVFLACRSFRHS